VLEVRGLTRRYSGLLAVDSVNLDVPGRGVYAVIGPNGAGKTTLFDMIFGVVAPSAGTIHLMGRDVTHIGADRRAALGLSRTFQNIRIFAGMTVLENVLTGLHVRLSASLLQVVARLGRFRREEREAVARARAALALVGLAERADQRAGTLSYGDRRRLEIARAMAAEPLLLLLDEPAAGMNPAETEALGELIGRIKGFGTAVLLVEHDMGFVMTHSDSITVLNFGRRIFHGPPASVRREPAVIEAYLGQKVADRLAQRGT
jgi:branched-chain amino acid transport system ATP-binding protein